MRNEGDPNFYVGKSPKVDEEIRAVWDLRGFGQSGISSIFFPLYRNSYTQILFVSCAPFLDLVERTHSSDYDDAFQCPGIPNLP